MKNFSSKTKENYLHKSSTSRFVTPIVFGVCALTLLFFGRSIVATISGYLLSPLYSVQQYIQSSSATIPVFIRSRNELEQEIRSLHQEIESQRGMQTSFELLIAENTELRNLLHASNSPSILAGVVARPPYTPYDSVVIDQGSVDGIVEEAPVFYGTGLALGYIQKVLPHHALVTLFSSPGIETTVYVFGPNIFATAYGDGGGVMHLSIPQGIEINVGDMVVLPSLTTGVLGTVSSVVSVASEPEQRAYVTYDIPIQSIRTVRVAEDARTRIPFDEVLKNVENMYTSLFMIDVPPDMQVTFPTSTATSSGTSTQQIMEIIE